MENKGLMSRGALLFAIIIFGLGLASAGWFVGHGLYKAKSANRYVTVKGLAEQEVRADTVLWSITFQASDDSLEVARAKVAQDHEIILRFLKNENLGNEPLEVQHYYMQDRMAQGYLKKDIVTTRFTVTKTLLLRSSKVNLVKAASQNISDLVAQDVTLYGSNTPTFVFSGLNEIKPQMIAQATRGARQAAEQFAIDSGSRVGKIRTANQGIFQILPLIETYGINVESEITKRVRLVTTITYELAD